MKKERHPTEIQGTCSVREGKFDLKCVQKREGYRESDREGKGQIKDI